MASCTRYLGGWAEYVQVRDERRRAEAAPARAERQREKKGKARNGRPGPSKNAQRAQKELEREIETAEKALHDLEDELADPAAWSSPERSAKSNERHDRAKKRVEELYARWETTAG